MQFLQDVASPLTMQMADTLSLFVSTIMKTRRIARLTLGESSINHTSSGVGVGVGVGVTVGQVVGQVVFEGGSSEKMRQEAHIT